jgi:hypothetical protein
MDNTTVVVPGKVSPSVDLDTHLFLANQFQAFVAHYEDHARMLLFPSPAIPPIINYEYISRLTPQLSSPLFNDDATFSSK